MKFEKLGDVFDTIRNGASIQQSRNPDGIPITRIETIANGEIDLNKLGYASIKDNSFEDYYLQEGDILMSHINSIPHLGKVAYFKETKNKIIHGMNLLCLKANRKILDPLFAVYFFKTISFRNSLKVITKKSVNQASFNISALKELTIPLPPLPDQIRIAEILSKAESLIAERKKSISLLDELSKSTFLEMFGDPVRNEKDWDVTKQLSDICEAIIDCPHSTPKYSEGRTEYLCIRSSDIQNGYIVYDDTKYLNLDEYLFRVKRGIPQLGDIIYCREGARFGNAGRIIDNKKVCLGQRMMLMRSDKINVNSAFLWSILNHSSVYNVMSQMVGGSASPHLNIKDIIKLQIPIPPLTLQNEFAAIVEKVEETKKKYQSGLEELENLYNSLSQRAFKGEL